MRIWLHWFLRGSVCCVLLISACSGSSNGGDADAGADAATPTDTSAPDELAAILQPILAAHGLPALGAAVFSGEELLALGTVGVRKQGDPTPATTADLWHIGSCTKAMTATLTATLVADGLVSWETSLISVFPDLDQTMDPAYREVTLEQLLVHRGGTMGSLLDYPNIWNPLWTDTRSLPEQRQWFVEQVLTQPPEVAPGTEFRYSNAGYMVAGAALEAATGKAWEELLWTRVFEPLDIDNCGFGPPGDASQVEQPWGHTTIEGTPVPQEPGPGADNPPALGPAGTVHCSLADWSKFARAHLRGARDDVSFLGTDAFTRMHAPWPGQEHALGWLVADQPWAGGPVLNHAGSNTMWWAVAVLAPGIDRGFLVTINRGDEAAQTASQKVVEELILRL